MRKRDVLRLQAQIDGLKDDACGIRLAISNEAAARKGEPQMCECGMPKEPSATTNKGPWFLTYKYEKRPDYATRVFDDIGPGVDKVKRQVFELRAGHEDLKMTIECAARGHKRTCLQVYGGGNGRTVVFGCANCSIKYRKDEKDLNEKEKALVKAFDMK